MHAVENYYAKDEIPVIVGPTASGKTGYAIRLALEIGAEIISADSVQVYRHVNIGAAKADPSEWNGIPHHMIDICEPDERFSVADYQKRALERLGDILSRGKRAIVAGGTGLYVSALVYNIKYPAFAEDPAYRERLEREALERGAHALHAELAAVDPAAAGRIHANDKKRIIRALEVFRATGKPITEHERLSRAEPPECRYSLTGLSVGREELRRRIDARTDRMMARGLPEEARSLFERYGRSAAALQAIGYKEFLDYFDGKRTLGETAELIKTDTRRYAKRQMTWFRPMPGIKWINAE